MKNLIQNLADQRHDLHENHASSRPLSDGYENVGLVGEVAFGMRTGLCPDFDLKPKGDGGFDFTIPLAFTVDVKTFRKPYNLIHESGKGFADIYVLAEFSDDQSTATLIGWEWGNRLRSAPTRHWRSGKLPHDSR